MSSSVASTASGDPAPKCIRPGMSFESPVSHDIGLFIRPSMKRSAGPLNGLPSSVPSHVPLRNVWESLLSIVKWYGRAKSVCPDMSQDPSHVVADAPVALVPSSAAARMAITVSLRTTPVLSLVRSRARAVSRADSRRTDPHHGVRLLKAGSGVARPVPAVEVGPELPRDLVAPRGVVAELPARVDVHHVQPMVAVDAAARDEVVREHHPRREPGGREAVVVERAPVRAARRRVVHGDRADQARAVRHLLALGDPR